MALTAAQKRKAVRWFSYTTFKRADRIAVIETKQIERSIEKVDEWLDAVPNAAEASNLASMRAVVPGPVRSALDPDEVLLLLAAVVMGRKDSKALNRA